MTGQFMDFLGQNRDQLTALRILYGLPASSKRLTYAGLEELRDAMLAPPWLPSAAFRYGAPIAGSRATRCGPIRPRR